MTTKEYVSMLFTEMQLISTDPSVVQSTNTVADGDRASYIIETALRNSQSTDWQSESLRPGGFKNIMLSATGGSKEMRYFVSGGYQNDEGMQNKSNYEKFNIRSKVDIDLSKKVKLTFNLNPSSEPNTNELPLNFCLRTLLSTIEDNKASILLALELDHKGKANI